MRACRRPRRLCGRRVATAPPARRPRARQAPAPRLARCRERGGAQILEALGQHLQIGQRRTIGRSRPARHRTARSSSCAKPSPAARYSFGRRPPSTRGISAAGRRQHAPADIGESGAHARRDVVTAGAYDRICRRPPPRSLPRLRPRGRARAGTARDTARPPARRPTPCLTSACWLSVASASSVLRRRVERLGARERVLCGGGDRGRDQRERRRSNVTEHRAHDYFLKSALSRVGPVSVTVAVIRCSPSSGCRNTTSCGAEADRQVADRRLADALAVHQHFGPRRGVERQRAVRAVRRSRGAGVVPHSTLRVCAIADRLARPARADARRRAADAAAAARAEERAVFEHVELVGRVDRDPSRRDRHRCGSRRGNGSGRAAVVGVMVAAVFLISTSGSAGTGGGGGSTAGSNSGAFAGSVAAVTG